MRAPGREFGLVTESLASDDPSLSVVSVGVAVVSFCGTCPCCRLLAGGRWTGHLVAAWLWAAGWCTVGCWLLVGECWLGPLVIGAVRVVCVDASPTACLTGRDTVVGWLRSLRVTGSSGLVGPSPTDNHSSSEAPAVGTAVEALCGAGAVSCWLLADGCWPESMAVACVWSAVGCPGLFGGPLPRADPSLSVSDNASVGAGGGCTAGGVADVVCAANK